MGHRDQSGERPAERAASSVNALPPFLVVCRKVPKYRSFCFIFLSAGSKYDCIHCGPQKRHPLIFFGIFSITPSKLTDFHNYLVLQSLTIFVARVVMFPIDF